MTSSTAFIRCWLCCSWGCGSNRVRLFMWDPMCATLELRGRETSTLCSMQVAKKNNFEQTVWARLACPVAAAATLSFSFFFHPRLVIFIFYCEPSVSKFVRMSHQPFACVCFNECKCQ